MKAAFVVFDRMTALDFVGVYDPLTRLRSMKIDPAFEWRVCGRQACVSDDRGLRICPDHVNGSLAGFDVLIVPGGHGTRHLREDAGFLDWLRTAEGVPLKASVCTGAVLLGAAGWLRDRPATTHASALAELAAFSARPVEQRVVDAGDLVTAAGVTAAIDLGLHLVGRFAGAEARARVAKQMEYPDPHGV